MIARPYQQRLVDRAEKALSTHGNTLAVAATGAGKTIMLAMLAGRIGGKQLVLQHRQELVRQNLQKFMQVNPKARCGLWTADTKTFRADTTFAMVQSLVGHIDRMPKLDLLVIDEAHHVAAPSFQSIIKAAREVNPDVKIAGFTATPRRTDKKGLRSVFDNVCDSITILELVELGFLVPPRGFVIDVSGTRDALLALPNNTSDFGEQAEVEKILNTVSVNDEVIRHWKERAAGRQTIVFCSTVKHAEDVAAAFVEAGVRAACVHGDMSDTSRKSTLSRFARGEIDVLTNVMVLTEGFDHPPVSCVILLRKSSDKSPLIQMAGRGLRTVDPRKFPGIVKKDCLIIDFGTSLLTHGDLSADEGLGKPDGEDVPPEKQKPKTCPSCGAELPCNMRVCPFCGYSFSSDDEPHAVRVELSEMDILNSSPFRYVDIFDSGRVLIASGFEAWAGLFSADDETWFAIGKTSDGALETVMQGVRLQAMSAADDFLRSHETDATAKKSKRWLDEPATDKQLDVLSRFGYRLHRDLLGNSGMTKYVAACHATFHFNRRGIERAIGL